MGILDRDGEPEEYGECRLRSRSASETRTGSRVDPGLKFEDGGGGIVVGSNGCWAAGNEKEEGEGIERESSSLTWGPFDEEEFNKTDAMEG